MSWFRRRRTERFVLQDACAPSAAELAASHAARRAEQRSSLRRIAAEAVIMQDEAEAVIQGIRSREPLGFLAPRGGPLVRRFFALRDALPRRCDDPGDEQLRAILEVTLHHHAVAVATALEFSAYEWRSERLARQVDALDGLGAPARQLDRVYATLTAL